MRSGSARSARAARLAAPLLCVLMAASPAAAQTGRDEVVAALEASGAAWSRGDLDGFMKIYEASPDAVYVGGKEPVRGYDAIRAMYAARFGAGPDAMGRLGLTVLDYKPLGPGYALLTGRFRLERPSAAPAEGLFTLVFHRGAAGWGVISDHTS